MADNNASLLVRCASKNHRAGQKDTDGWDQCDYGNMGERRKKGERNREREREEVIGARYDS